MQDKGIYFISKNREAPSEIDKYKIWRYRESPSFDWVSICYRYHGAQPPTAKIIQVRVIQSIQLQSCWFPGRTKCMGGSMWIVFMSKPYDLSKQNSQVKFKFLGGHFGIWTKQDSTQVCLFSLALCQSFPIVSENLLLKMAVRLTTFSWLVNGVLNQHKVADDPKCRDWWLYPRS